MTANSDSATKPTTAGKSADNKQKKVSAAAASAAAAGTDGGLAHKGKSASAIGSVAAAPAESSAAAPGLSASQLTDVRVAVVGNVDSGKSTLIGVLTGGGLDDGRGAARSRIFVHAHEAANGRTSCVSHHIMGFGTDGKPVHQPVAASATAAAKTKSWREVVRRSRSLVTFVDLAGHSRYLKTTIAGLTGTFPDHAVVIVGANMGVTKMTREHIKVVLALSIPLAVVVTKIDVAPPNVLARTKKALQRLLRSPGARKKTFEVRCEKDVATCLSMPGNKVCPVFPISTVTGENLGLLTMWLGQIKPRGLFQLPDSAAAAAAAAAAAKAEKGEKGEKGGNDDDGGDERKVKKADGDDGKQLPQFLVQETFSVTGVGLVLSGTVLAGTLVAEAGTQMMLGPLGDGAYCRVNLRSLQCKRSPVSSAPAGVSCTVAIKSAERKRQLRRTEIRPGMVLVEKGHEPNPAWCFEAEAYVMHHPTTIKRNYQAVIHCGLIRQTAALVSLGGNDCLRTGDRSKVVFRFVQRPELLRVGQRIIFREGDTKGVGKVVRVLSDEEHADLVRRETAAKEERLREAARRAIEEARAEKARADAERAAAEPDAGGADS